MYFAIFETLYVRVSFFNNRKEASAYVQNYFGHLGKFRITTDQSATIGLERILSSSAQEQ